MLPLDSRRATERPLVARFIPEWTTNGLSVIARPRDHSETLAGAFICRDFKSPLPAGVPRDFPWLTPTAEALMKRDGVNEAKRPGLVLGEDFRFQGRAVFAGVEPPHTDLILFEREF